MKLFLTLLASFILKFSSGQNSVRLELDFKYVGDSSRLIKIKPEFKSIEIINKDYPFTRYYLPYDSIAVQDGHYFISLPDKRGYWWLYFKDANVDINDYRQAAVYFLCSCSNRKIELKYKEIENKGGELENWSFTPYQPKWIVSIEQLSENMSRRQARRIMAKRFFVSASYSDGSICDIEYSGDNIKYKDKERLIKYITTFNPPIKYGSGFTFTLSSRP